MQISYRHFKHLSSQKVVSLLV